MLRTITYYEGPGALALDAVHNKHPNIILLGLAMPVMDVYEGCVRLRHETWGKDVPVIALTGYGHEQDVAQALHCAFSGFIWKPIGRAIFRNDYKVSVL